MKSKTNPAWLETMRAVQARWGIPRAELVRAKSAGCEAFRGGRIYRDELVEWLAANPRPAGEGQVENIRVEKVRKQVEKLSLEIDTQRGKLVSRETAKQFFGEVVNDIFDLLDKALDREQYNRIARELKIRIGTRAEVTAAHL
jgi:hypothetical protein